MADAKLKIVIDAVNNAKSELDGLKKQLEGVEAPSKKADGGLRGMMNALKAAGITAAAVKFGKMAYELGEMGAQAERTEASFARMAGGTDKATDLLDTLKNATMGTKSEMELMASATNLMALGFGKSADQMGNIMRNVEALGARFGGNMQTFQLMMSNDSLMRIDSFGIGVEEATKRINEYKAAGMDAGKAFDTAVLDLMNEKFDMLGGNVQDATTEILQSKAAWADFKTEAGRAFTGFTESMATSSTGIVTWFTDILKYTRQAREQFGYVSGSLDGMAYVFGINNEAVKGFGDSMEDLNQSGSWAWGGGATVILDSAEAWAMYAKAQEKSSNQVREFADYTGDSLEMFNMYTFALEQGEESIRTGLNMALAETAAQAATVNAQYSLLVTAMDSGIGPAIDAYQEKQGELNLKLDELNAELIELEGNHGRAITVTKKATQTELEANLATLQLAEAQAKLAAETDPLKAAQLAVKIEDLQGKLSGATTATTTYVDNSKKMDEVRKEIEETEAALAELEAEHTRQTGQILMNFSQQMIAADGVITQEELDWVAALGAEYGILDERGESALTNLKRNFDLVNSGALTARDGVNLLAGSIDALHGKEIEIKTVFVERHRQIGGPSAPYEQNASGGWLNTGSVSLVGERGPELIYATSAGVQIEPLSGAGAGDGAALLGATWTGDIVIQGVSDPEAAANAVIRKLADRGIVRAGGYR